MGKDGNGQPSITRWAHPGCMGWRVQYDLTTPARCNVLRVLHAHSTPTPLGDGEKGCDAKYSLRWRANLPSRSARQPGTSLARRARPQGSIAIYIPLTTQARPTCMYFSRIRAILLVGLAMGAMGPHPPLEPLKNILRQTREHSALVEIVNHYPFDSQPKYFT